MPEFTVTDYQNLAAIVSLAKVEGIQQASALLVLYDKLQKAAEEMGRPTKQFPDEVEALQKE